MPICRLSTLNDLDDRQTDILARLDELERQIELLLNDWSTAVQAELREDPICDQGLDRAAA